jgi:hypothetical protein
LAIRTAAPRRKSRQTSRSEETEGHSPHNLPSRCLRGEVYRRLTINADARSLTPLARATACATHHPTLPAPLRRAALSPLQHGLDFARPGIITPGLLRLSAIVLSAAGMALMLISLRPFISSSLVSETSGDGGSIVNQIGFLAAGLVFAVAMMCLASRKCSPACSRQAT